MRLFNFIEIINKHRFKYNFQSLDYLEIYFKENNRWSFTGVEKITADYIRAAGVNTDSKYPNFTYQMDFSKRPGQDEIKELILVENTSCMKFIFEQDEYDI